MDVKDIIKARRIELGLSQEDVAKRVGVSDATVSRWESGEIENMGLSRITALAKVLKVSPLVIMDWTNDSTPDANVREPSGNGDLMAIREQLRRQPGMRILFDASKNATDKDLLDAAALIEGFKRRRDGDE